MSKQAIPLLALTIVASATLVAERFCTQAGGVPAAAANVLGVVRQAAVSGDKVTVDALGTAIVEAGAAIAAGATLSTDASGRAITWAVSGAKVALALQAASGAGQFIEVLLIPNVA
jgi:hypothetical protein